MPSEYGDRKNTHRLFCRWCDKGIWARLQESLIKEPDYGWLMIDASHIKGHPHASGARGGHQDMGVIKGGPNSKIHLAIDEHGMPITCILTSGVTADCTQATSLIDGLEAAYLLADRGYDTDALMEVARAKGMEPVIPSKRNRKEQRAHDRVLYMARHQVENAFLHLKQWRGIVTRYAKNTRSFVATVQTHCTYMWASNS